MTTRTIERSAPWRSFCVSGLLAALLAIPAAVTTALAAGSPDFQLDLELGFDAPADGEASPPPEAPARADELLRSGLDRVDWLEGAGAMALAERVLRNQRPGVDRLDEWMVWERRLWRNLAQRRMWAELAERGAALDRDMPADFVLEAASVGVDALMQQREYAAARQRLRRLLLQTGLEPATRADILRRIFTTYLWDEDLDNANIAMRRYERDYYPDDHAWNLLRARVQIRSGEPARAISQIASVTTPEGVLVGLYARLLDGSLTANEVLDRILEVKPGGLKDDLRRERVALMAAAAGRAGVLPLQVESLEKALSIPAEGASPLIPVDADDLVEAYLALARRMGNSGHLLVGDYQGWLEYADSELGSGSPGARAVYTYVGRGAGIPELAGDAFSRLALSLRDAGLETVVYQLFGEEGVLGGYDMFTGAVGLALSEEALSRGNVRLAAALSAPIKEAPAGVTPFDWRLRQARMAVYAGRADEGVEILRSLLRALVRLSADETDRVLQVLFDLQALDRHAEAIPLLERTLDLAEDRERQREILFWLAESKEADGAADQAALLFLRSATLSAGNEIWAQTARYRAAAALQQAGLVDDARALYQQLLAVTRDPSRREQLTRKLQDLWLQEARDAGDAEAEG